MAAEQSPDLLERGLLATDIVGRRVVFVCSPGDIKFAVGDDFVVISFLAQRGEGQKTHRSLEQLSSEATQITLSVSWGHSERLTNDEGERYRKRAHVKKKNKQGGLFGGLVGGGNYTTDV